MKQNNSLITIIIPVYNLEDYIGKALDSIYAQEVDDKLYEIIAVDDGSTDKSLNILQKYAQRFNNLYVYSNKNHGVSFSRNFAIGRAKGKYITFLDGDDQLLPNSLQQTIEFIIENPTDVLYELTYIDKGYLIPGHTTPPKIIAGKFYKIAQLGDFCNGGGSVCGGIYSTDFINNNNIRFPEGIANGEDTIFNYLLFTKDPNIVFADISLYKVTVREGSASRHITIDRAVRCALNIRYLSQLIKDNKYNSQQVEYIHKAFWNAIGNGVGMLIQCGVCDSSVIWNKLELNLVPKLCIKRVSFITRLKVCIFNYCFPLYVKLFILREIR